MKKILVLTIVLLAAISLTAAGGECPASPGDIIGQIRCGESVCGELVRYMTYQGGSCNASQLGVCCIPRGPATKESIGSLDLYLVHPNGNPFNYLPGSVRLMDRETGEEVMRGTFRRGVFRWQNGSESVDSLVCGK